MMNRRMASWALFTATAGALALPLHAAEQATPKVQLKTSLGTIVVQLDPAKAPKTVENFLQYVKDKHYDGTIFHRVINGFMIQGGGFTPDMAQKPTRAPIPLEAKNGRRTMNTPSPWPAPAIRTRPPRSSSSTSRTTTA